jgi:hypothetical protein
MTARNDRLSRRGYLFHQGCSAVQAVVAHPSRNVILSRLNLFSATPASATSARLLFGSKGIYAAPRHVEH